MRASKHRPEFGVDAQRGGIPRRSNVLRQRRMPVPAVHCTVAFEAVLQEVLEMPAEKHAWLVERAVGSPDDEVELSADELAQLDDTAMDADRAAERGELLPQHVVLGYMRQIS